MLLVVSELHHGQDEVFRLVQGIQDLIASDGDRVSSRYSTLDFDEPEFPSARHSTLNVVAKLLGAQMPVLSWWAICAVLTFAAGETTKTVTVPVFGDLLDEYDESFRLRVRVDPDSAALAVEGGAFIAFHGSWNRGPQPQDGYNVTFQPFAGGKPSGTFEVFADGFAGKTPLMVALTGGKGVGMAGGRSRAVAAIAELTSCAAASISRLRLNWIVTEVVPWPLTDVMESMPAMVENCFSSTVATAEAIVLGDAPGSSAVTWMVG